MLVFPINFIANAVLYLFVEKKKNLILNNYH